MHGRLDRRRIALFLALTFGIAWAVALVVVLSGGPSNSPMLVPQYGITLAVVLIFVVYMWAPALAHALTRAITGEGWGQMGLRPGNRAGYLAAWFLPALLILPGALAYYLAFPSHFSTRAVELLRGQAPVDPWMNIAGQALMLVILGPLFSGPFTFGEEFGWRGYLLPRLRPLGPRRAMLVMGLIWGVWYWPLILMGFTYGVNYPGAPWTGLLAVIWMAFVQGTFLNWITLSSRSIWPAVLARGAMSSANSLPLLFLAQQPVTVLGPTLSGVLGSIGFAVLAVYLLTRIDVLAPDRHVQVSEAPAE